MTPSIQKVLESFEEKFCEELGEGLYTLTNDDANDIKSFLTTALEEIHQTAYDLGYKAGHHEGYEKALNEIKHDQKKMLDGFSHPKGCVECELLKK